MQSSAIIIMYLIPQAHLRRFFGEGNKGDYLFLIDEAHNLVERGMADVQCQYLQRRFSWN